MATLHAGVSLCCCATFVGCSCSMQCCQTSQLRGTPAVGGDCMRLPSPWNFSQRRLGRQRRGMVSCMEDISLRSTGCRSFSSAFEGAGLAGCLLEHSESRRLVSRRPCRLKPRPSPIAAQAFGGSGVHDGQQVGADTVEVGFDASEDAHESNGSLLSKAKTPGDGSGAAEGTPEKLEKVVSNGGLAGMAEAFDISPRLAYGITTGIACTALVMPIFMQGSLSGAVISLKTRVLTYLTLLCGFYMAWNIGANDVANAMGTSVGSGALTLRQAVVTAAFLEFAGAFLVGSHVSHTMQNGILASNVFSGKESLLFCGMLSSLAAAGTWLQVASWYGWPVSTTHCIIGAMVGFGLAYGGFGAVYWGSLARVVSSWVVSPLMGAAVSFVVYKSIRAFVYSASNPGKAACKAAPVAVFIGVAALMFCSLVASGNVIVPAIQSIASGAAGALVMHLVVQSNLNRLIPSGKAKEVAVDKGSDKSRTGGPTGLQLQIVYSVFGYLQVLSACFMSFAHGANDVANAIGPISAALALLSGTALQANIGISVEVLAWGGFGIVAGLLVWGYRVIATIGSKITELTPTRGFAAEFAAATVVVIASRCGLPVSATHTLVGAVMGVGFARGLNSIRGETVREIVLSWLVTIPIGAMLAVVYTRILTSLISTPLL
uniref:Phosphate transporter n=1 Tax=Coleochaete nitellarum TaxID=78178 RepID=A0A1Q1NHC3_COLNI|nr:inorganic phosphate transporter 2-1 [Coleochaete nitellarum]